MEPRRDRLQHLLVATYSFCYLLVYELRRLDQAVAHSE